MRRYEDMKIRILAIACLLMSGCDTPTVPERFLRDVYEFRLLTPDPQVMRWPAGSTIKLFVVPDADATRTAYLRAAVAHGITVWNNAALYGEFQLAEAGSVEVADVVVEYSLTPSPLDLSSCAPGGGFAYTTFCLDPDDDSRLASYDLRDGTPSNVKFVLTVRSSSATDATNVRRLVTHELGHVLGIARHSPKQTDIMWEGTLNRDDPSPADRATLQVLYHTQPDITP